MPIPDLGKRTQFYSSNVFTYDAEKDQYTCPQGKILPLVSRRKSEEVFVYRANAEVCNACPVKAECTNSKSGRHIFRSFHHVYVERVQEYHQTQEYQKAMRKRGYWVEPLFGEAKDFHRLRRFRLRGLLKVNIEGVMVAAGQNLKRLIKHKSNELFNLSTFIRISRHSTTPTFSTLWKLVRPHYYQSVEVSYLIRNLLLHFPTVTTLER